MKWIATIAMLSVCLVLASCAQTQVAKRSPEALAEMKRLMATERYQEAAAWFEKYDPRGGFDGTSYVDEFCLLGSKAFQELAVNEPDKKQRDDLFRKAAQALSRW